MHQWLEGCGVELAPKLGESQVGAFAALPKKTGRDRYGLFDEAVDDLLEKYRRKASMPER